MKRLLLLAVLMVATATVTAQDLRFADRMFCTDYGSKTYNTLEDRGYKINYLTPPPPEDAVTATYRYKEDARYAEHWRLFHNNAKGGFRRVVIHYQGPWCATCIGAFFGLGYKLKSDQTEEYKMPNLTVQCRVIRFVKEGVEVLFVDPYTEPTGITEAYDDAALYGGEYPVGDFIVDFNRTN